MVSTTSWYFDSLACDPLVPQGQHSHEDNPMYSKNQIELDTDLGL
jgi:hypothetical protein